MQLFILGVMRVGHAVVGSQHQFILTNLIEMSSVALKQVTVL